MLKGRAQELQQIIEQGKELSLGQGFRQMKEIGRSLILSKDLNEQLDNLMYSWWQKMYSFSCVCHMNILI